MRWSPIRCQMLEGALSQVIIACSELTLKALCCFQIIASSCARKDMLFSVDELCHIWGLLLQISQMAP